MFFSSSLLPDSISCLVMFSSASLSETFLCLCRPIWDGADQKPTRSANNDHLYVSKLYVAWPPTLDMITRNFQNPSKISKTLKKIYHHKGAAKEIRGIATERSHGAAPQGPRAAPRGPCAATQGRMAPPLEVDGAVRRQSRSVQRPSR